MPASQKYLSGRSLLSTNGANYPEFYLTFLQNFVKYYKVNTFLISTTQVKILNFASYSKAPPRTSS